MVLVVGDPEPFALEIKADGICIHVRDFAHVQAQEFEQGFGIYRQAAGAQLGAWITFFFQKQDAERSSKDAGQWKARRALRR